MIIGHQDVYGTEVVKSENLETVAAKEITLALETRLKVLEGEVLAFRKGTGKDINALST